MTGFSAGKFEKLWEDRKVIISRGRRDENGSPVLLLVPGPEAPLPATLTLFEQAWALRGELDAAWAARPLEVAEFGGRPALLIEDPGGEFLDGLIGGPLAVPEFLQLALAIVTALGHFHARGLIHRDLKPANLLVKAATGEAWLTGFGLALRLPRHRPSLQPPEVMAGTLAYMAPEQTGRMNRSIDSRSDLYSLGITFYEMLVGARPFTAGDPLEWVHCHLARLPTPLSERLSAIPEAISDLVLKLLAKAPEDRYQTAAGVEADLRRCLAGWEAHGRIEPFALGAHDASGQLRAPETLYGRQPETELLLAAFARVVRQGTAELVLVSGHPGVGKSSVVQELHKALALPRGLFASGKFDQYQRDIPYATLAQAFQALVRQVMAQDDAGLAHWRQALREALGTNGQLMVSLIPELERLIGKQPLVPDLPPPDTKNRFQTVFRRFLGVFARPEHPLALFLDDLQWLDAATLELLEHLLTQPDVQHLLLLGAYRDNEVGLTHPLARTLEAVRKGGASVQDIVLSPLRLEDVGRLVAEALHCEPAHAWSLAQLVQEKTGGNPFFTIQFLSGLNEEGLLTFDAGAAAWRWDLERIRAKGFTDNVINFMAATLSRLPEPAQAALGPLACLGNRAPAATLGMVLGLPEEKIHAALGEAVRLGLVARSAAAYSFVHDRVQEAAYALIPEGERAAAHLRIGRVLASPMGPAAIEDNIFEIVNQFNRAAALIASREERERVAELNLVAGKRAKASTAYASALGYLSAGSALLREESGEPQQALAFELKLQQAACALLSADFTAAEQLIAETLTRAKSKVDQAAAYRLRIELDVLRSENERAVGSALECLRLFDIQMSPHPDRAQLDSALEDVWRKLNGRLVETLIDLPPVTDAEVEAAMSVLSVLYAPAFFTDEILTALHLCHTISLTLEHGMSGASAHAFGLFGMMLGHFFGRYADGYQFGQLAHALVKRHGFIAYEAKTLKAMEELSVWTQPITTAVNWIRAAFLAANESGDVTVACYACNHTVTDLLARGDHLDEAWQEAERCLAYVRRAKFRDVADVIVAQRRFIQNMRGRTASFFTFDGDGFDQSSFEEQLTPQRNTTMVCWYWIIKAKACFIFGEYEQAARALEHARPLLWSSIGRIQYLDYHLFSALTLTVRDTGLAPGAELMDHRQQLRAHCEQFANWTESCPTTFTDKFLLITAEIARIEGRALEAEHLYEEAIRLARENGFIQNEAIANEVAARFYAARGLETIAHAYLRHARHCYLRWGADGKVRQLEQCHPALREELAPSPPRVTIGSHVGHLDVETVVKASQALSSEIVLDDLIRKLLVIAAEHAGAERGLLILLRGSEPRVEAEATTGRDAVEVTVRPAAVSPSDLPAAVLHDVIRTRRSVVLDDASAHNLYSQDEYVRRKRPRSVLCLPIVKLTKLVGALYLENKLTSHAFTSERVAVLDFLASQAAICLENARLYADLKQENLERKQAEEKLRRSEGLLVEGQRISRTGSWIWNTKTGTLHCSAEQQRIFGILPDRAELTFDDFARKIHPEDRPFALQAIDDAVRVRGCFDQQFRIVLPNGSVAYIQGSGHPLVQGAGAVEEYIGAIMDVTDQYRTETALEGALAEVRESENRFRTIIETLPSLVWGTQVDGSAEYLSPSWLTYTGLSMEKAMGWGWTVAIHPDDVGKMVENWQEILASKKPGEQEARLRRFDGEYHWFLFRGAPLIDHRGNVVKWYGTNTDIEDLKQAEVELRRREAALRKAQAELAHVTRVTTMGELAASIAHEVNQPIAGVVINSNACLRWLARLKDDSVNLAEAREAVQRIIRDGTRAGEVIARIRALFKKTETEKEPLEINELIREVIVLARSEMDKKRVALRLELTPELPRVLGDRVQLQQVMLNLILNGIEAMSTVEDRTRELIIGTRPQAEADVLVMVRDCGNGLDPESVEQIFTAFHTTKPGGLGMGLPISRSIVENHNGRLWATLNNGPGVTFQFTLLTHPPQGGPGGWP